GRWRKRELLQVRDVTAGGSVRTQGERLGIRDFVWQGLPSRVVMAPGAARNLVDETDRFGMSRIMLVSGRRTAAAERVQAVVDALGSRVVLRFCDIPAHSDEDRVMEGVEAARENDIDGL